MCKYIFILSVYNSPFVNRTISPLCYGSKICAVLMYHLTQDSGTLKHFLFSFSVVETRVSLWVWLRNIVRKKCYGVNNR